MFIVFNYERPLFPGFSNLWVIEMPAYKTLSIIQHRPWVGRAELYGLFAHNRYTLAIFSIGEIHYTRSYTLIFLVFDNISI